MLVVGATWSEQIAQVREIVGDMPLLIPDVGAQGGDVEQLVKAGQTTQGTGLLIYVMRSRQPVAQAAPAQSKPNNSWF